MTMLIWNKCGHNDGQAPNECPVCMKAELEKMKLQVDALTETLKMKNGQCEDMIRLLREEQKKADGFMAVLGAIRAVLIMDQGDNLSPELRKALWLDEDTAIDLQRARRELVEAVRAWRHGNNATWPRVEIAMDALEKIEKERVDRGLPLETRIIERPKPETEPGPEGPGIMRNCHPLISGDQGNVREKREGRS